jgi:hypothetical protein
MGTLKHKQVWKKQNVHRQTTNSNNKFKQKSLTTTSPTISSTTNESIQHDRLLTKPLPIKSIMTFSDYNNSRVQMMTKRNNKVIHFNEKVSVLLIPCRQEYLEANLGNIVWWKSPDYRQFQFDAFSEVKESLKGKILTSSNVKQALKELYQNEYELKLNTYMNTIRNSDIDVLPSSDVNDNVTSAPIPAVNCDVENFISRSQSAYSLLQAVNMQHIRMNADSMIHANNSNFAMISI